MYNDEFITLVYETWCGDLFYALFYSLQYVIKCCWSHLEILERFAVSPAILKIVFFRNFIKGLPNFQGNKIRQLWPYFLGDRNVLNIKMCEDAHRVTVLEHNFIRIRIRSNRSLMQKLTLVLEKLIQNKATNNWMRMKLYFNIVQKKL